MEPSVERKIFDGIQDAVLGEAIIKVSSPVEIMIYDSEGKKVGYANGVALSEISGAYANAQDEVVSLPSITNNFGIKLSGTANDAYGLQVYVPIAVHNPDGSMTLTYGEYQIENVVTHVGKEDFLTFDIQKLNYDVQEKVDRGQSLAEAVRQVFGSFDMDADGIVDSLDNNLSASRKPCSIVLRSSASYAGAKDTLAAKLFSLNVPLAGQQLVFKEAGVVIGQARTDSRGEAILVYAIPPDRASGIYQLAVEFSGNGAVQPTSTAVKLAINDKPPEVRFVSPAKGEQVTGSIPLIVDILDENLASWKVFVDDVQVPDTSSYLPTGVRITCHLPTDTLSDGAHALRIETIDHTQLSASEICNVYIDNHKPPATPEEVRAVSGDARIMLLWNLNNEKDLSGYEVYRSITSGSGYAKLNTEPVSPLTDFFLDENVVNGTSYYYVLKAVDRSGLESAFSGEVFAVPGPESEPPRAAIMTDPQSPVGAGKVSVFLSTSEPLLRPPTLGLIPFGETAAIPITLSGSGDTWLGELNVTSNLPSGAARFVFLGEDLSGNTESTIVIGDTLRILITAIEEPPTTRIPETFALQQNYPNPFNAGTMIRFELPKACPVAVKIFSIYGAEIRTLVNAHYDAGFHRVLWDGKDKYGNPVSSGVYLYQIQAGTFSQVKKMILLR